MSQRYLFTSESVTEGHPDKLCDQVSDGVLDAICSKDPEAKVACVEPMFLEGFQRARAELPGIEKLVVVDGEGGDLTLAKARAIENQVYLVSSTYDMVTGVFDLEGNILKQANADKEVVVVDVDLNAQKLWPWLGDLKNRIPRERPSKKAVEDYQTAVYR